MSVYARDITEQKMAHQRIKEEKLASDVNR
jgi:hypothetical protein